MAKNKCIMIKSYWPAPRLSTDHSGLECASVIEFSSCLFDCLSANIIIYLLILLCLLCYGILKICCYESQIIVARMNRDILTGSEAISAHYYTTMCIVIVPRMNPDMY